MALKTHNCERCISLKKKIKSEEIGDKIIHVPGEGLTERERKWFQEYNLRV